MIWIPIAIASHVHGDTFSPIAKTMRWSSEIPRRRLPIFHDMTINSAWLLGTAVYFQDSGRLAFDTWWDLDWRKNLRIRPCHKDTYMHVESGRQHSSLSGPLPNGVVIELALVSNRVHHSSTQLLFELGAALEQAPLGMKLYYYYCYYLTCSSALLYRNYGWPACTIKGLTRLWLR